VELAYPGIKLVVEPIAVDASFNIHRRWLILFSSVPFQIASAMISAPRFTKSTYLESVL
jgi:hypothetical protein